MQGIDCLFLQFTISKTLERSASVHLLFAFEYIIQCSIIVSTFIKYLLSAFDSYMDGRWENKVCNRVLGSFQGYELLLVSLPHGIATCIRALQLVQLQLPYAFCPAMSNMLQLTLPCWMMT